MYERVPIKTILIFISTYILIFISTYNDQNVIKHVFSDSLLTNPKSKSKSDFGFSLKSQVTI